MGDARETEKAPDAFRTISEVADDLELPQHVLRFWESRFTQIKPVKRAGGRRFYRPEDVDLLRGIRHLLYTDGYTIKGAQRILKDQGVRFVQDLGIEREVAVMRTAKPPRPAGGEGVTFGGLLGLIPRRRGKVRDGEDDGLPALPETAELPLPFPDPEADRDLLAEPPSASIPLRPTGRGQRGAPVERRDPAFDAPAAGRERREPSLGADRQRGAEDPDPPEPPHPQRVAPRPTPHGTRVEPMLEPRAPQRPSRGPAARLPLAGELYASTAPHPHAPELDDPLLPFLDEASLSPSVSEPIEDRIRRLRSQERRPPRPHEWPDEQVQQVPPARPLRSEAEDDLGPPEDYIPSRARRVDPRATDWPSEAHAPRHGEPDEDRSAPSVGRRDASGRLLRDGDWQQTDWVAGWERDDGRADERGPPRGAREEPAWDDDHDDGGAFPERDPRDHLSRHRPSPRPSSHGGSDAHPFAASSQFAEPEYRMSEQDRPRASAPRQHDARRDLPPAAPARDGWPTGESEGAIHKAPAPAQPRSAPSWPDEAVHRAWDAGWGDSPPQALPRATRVGPLIGPIQDEDELSEAPMPESEQRLLADRMADRPADRVAARGAGWPASHQETRPPAPSHQPAPRQPSWGRPEMPAPSLGVEPPSPGEPPPRMPREPLRPGPPEQYLPPHLRSEPRVVGQAPFAAPVLSREDVHRMQSALYELGECRRLMESVLAPRGTAGGGD